MAAPAPTDAASPSRRTTPLVGGIAVLAITALWGAWQLEFLCDDAFIAFRYVSNAHLGHGLVWNPAPFAPVEGYTCFAWVLCLWAVWSWFGVEPPQAANVLSMICGLALFLVTARAAMRIRDRDGRALSTAAVLCVLLVVAGNRTFLTWWTSGLETALFNLAFVAWVVLAFRAPARRTAGWALLWASAAAVAALTRPDGLLVVAATLAALACSALRRQLRPARVAVAALPLALALLHVLWRRWFYGEWLPNTYYAKVTAPWPEAGCRYLALFLFEHGAWLWLPIGLLWLIAELRRGARAAYRALAANLPALAAVVVVAAHVGYYVVRVGGDPFEYRVLSQLVPLGALAVAAAMARVRPGSLLPITATLAVGLGSTVGWLHLALSEPDLTPFYRPTFHKLPAFAQPLARWHDRTQAWLQVQVLCGRRELHAMFLARQRVELPERRHTTADADDLPVAAFTGVGLAGWVLPDVAVLDLLGLNDWVVARTPIGERRTPLLPQPVLDALLTTADADHDGRYTAAELRAQLQLIPGTDRATVDGLAGFLLLLFADDDPDAMTVAEAQRIAPFFTDIRFMAHERIAPPGYVEALAPNVTVERRQTVVRPRATPLTAERVREIEAEWRQRVP